MNLENLTFNRCDRNPLFHAQSGEYHYYAFVVEDDISLIVRIKNGATRVMLSKDKLPKEFKKEIVGTCKAHYWRKALKET